MEVAIVVVALLGFAAFRQWLQHQRRVLVHRERLAALEKGIELPPLEAEARRGTWNVQRLLLLFGWMWVLAGAATFVLLSVLLAYPPNNINRDIAPGMQYVGLIGVGIGAAHLITYWAGARRDTP